MYPDFRLIIVYNILLTDMDLLKFRTVCNRTIFQLIIQIQLNLEVCIHKLLFAATEQYSQEHFYVMPLVLYLTVIEPNKIDI